MNMRVLFLSLFFLFSSISGYSQNDSPYRINLKVDLPVTVAGIGLSYYGMKKMQAKKGLTEQEVLELRKNDVNAFDRFSAGYDSEKADMISDYPFYGSFVAPALLLVNSRINSNALQVGLLYLETMAISGALWTNAVGHVERIRPNAYSPNVPVEEKMRGNSTNAFYGGHNSGAAAATFFAAKVFHDFNPDSPARPYVWAAAAAVPATVSYLRLKAGKHFMSDILLGYVLGASAGILVPQLHKQSNTTFSLTPVAAPDFGGAAMTYSF